MTAHARPSASLARSVCFALGVVALAMHAAAAAPEPKAAADSAKTWPIYRGNPALQGVSAAKLPTDFGVRWRFKTEGPIKSSAVIGGGRAYVGSDDMNVYAIDLATGEKAWAFKTEAAVEAPPLLLGDTVYAGSNDGFVYALGADTGELKWKFETFDKIVGSCNYTPAPDGEAMWIIFGSHDNFLYCVNARTGKQVWKYETDNFINGTPAVHDGAVVFGGCDGLLHVISVADGTRLTTVDLSGSYVVGSVALTRDRAYLGHYGNRFIAADTKEGKILWEFGEREFPFFASPAVTEKYVVFGGRDKRVHCVQRETGKPVWSVRFRGRVDSSPVVADGKVVVGSDDGKLSMFDLPTGNELWSFEIGQAVTAAPAVIDGTIVVGAEDGVVYCFQAK